MGQRDLQLDIYRALLLIWVVCVIHNVHLLFIGSDATRDYVIFAMPLIFFVAGASARMARRGENTFKQLLAKNFSRIYVPYFIFLALMLVTAPLTIRIFGIEELNPRDIPRALLGAELDYHYLTSYLWFIPVYFIISVSVGVQAKAMKRVGERYYFLMLLILTYTVLWAISEYKIAGHVDWQMALVEVLAYNLFYICGYVFYRRVKTKYILCAAVAAVGAFVMLRAADTAPMNIHKFPPDHVYLTFGLAALCVFSLPATFVKLPAGRIMRIWISRGYNIYIYEFFLFSIMLMAVSYLTGHSIVADKTATVITIASSVAIFIVATVLSYFTTHYEQVILKIAKKFMLSRSTKQD